METRTQVLADSNAPVLPLQPVKYREVTPHVRVTKVHHGLFHNLLKELNIHPKGEVAGNEISTGKYTLLTFLPVNLFLQFMR